MHFSSQQAKNWYCAKDLTPVYLDQNGNMKCGKLHSSKIRNCRWNCGKHHHELYQTTDISSFQMSLSMAIQMVDHVGAAWVACLVTRLGEQFEYVLHLSFQKNSQKFSPLQTLNNSDIFDTFKVSPFRSSISTNTPAV